MEYRYIDIIKEFLSFKAYNTKINILHFMSALIRDSLTLLFPFLAALIIETITNNNYTIALNYIIALGITYLIYLLFYHLNYVIYTKNTNDVYNKLQDKVLKKVLSLDENFTRKIPKSYLINTVSTDIERASDLPDVIYDAISHIINLIITAVILCNINIIIGIIAIFTNIFYFLSLNYNSLKREYWMLKQQKCQDKVVGLTSDIIDGNKEVKAFDLDEKLNIHLNNIKKSFKKAYFTKRKYWNRMKCILPVILFSAKILAYITIIILIALGRADVALLILVIGYYERIESENDTLFKKLSQIGSRTTKVHRLYKLFNYNPKLNITFGDNNTNNIKGVIDFNNVSFSYDKQTLLKNVSFHIKPMNFTAIVGQSGSGKSTIFRLLLRLYKPDKGNITIDAIDIFSYSKDIYPSNVSITTQKPFIFNMSIKDNLNMINTSQTKQIEACKRVGIHDFIESLPKGYNTILKENATDISGGQKQLISIARVLLSEAEILLFDEVTSSLDPNNVKKIITVLKDLKKDHTVVVITHNPELMKKADNIIVMDKGKIIAQGKHKDLLNNKYYQKLQK